MTQPIDLAERQALATARDYPADFDKPHGWQVCGNCNRVFLGKPSRQECRCCSGETHGC